MCVCVDAREKGSKRKKRVRTGKVREGENDEIENVREKERALWFCPIPAKLSLTSLDPSSDASAV